MSIEEAIYILENGLNVDGSWQKALDIAIDTMRKYQQLQEMPQCPKNRSFLETDDIMGNLKRW